MWVATKPWPVVSLSPYNDKMDLLVTAASRSSLAVLELLTADHVGSYNQALRHIACAAAEHGQLRVLEWLLRRFQILGGQFSSLGAPFGYYPTHAPNAVLAAAANGHTQIVAFLLHHGWPCHGQHLCAQAAKDGLLDLLQLCHEFQIPWDGATTVAAAAAGHLDALEFAYARGCPVSQQAVEQAAKNGHVHVVRWAQQCGLAITTEVLINAATHGHLAVVEYIMDGTPSPPAWPGEAACCLPFGTPVVAVCDWALQRGLETASVDSMVRHGLSDLVEHWIRRHPLRPVLLSDDTIIKALSRHPHVIHWLHRRGHLDLSQRRKPKRNNNYDDDNNNNNHNNKRTKQKKRIREREMEEQR